MWLISWGRLPCDNHLVYRNIIPTPNCSFCPYTEEDAEHIFFTCPRALEFWEEAGTSEYQLNGSSTNFNEWFHKKLARNDLNGKFNASWSSIFTYSLWCLWNRRSMWICRKESKPVDIVWKENLYLVNEYLTSSPSKLLTQAHCCLIWLALNL